VGKTTQRTYAARAWATVVITAATLGLSVCDRVVDPPLPADAEQYSPPAVYALWWNMTRECSGLAGSLDAVTWYRTNETLREDGTGDRIIGYWSSATNRIVMAASAVLDGPDVRHEMLHALVRKTGHPRDQFLGACNGTVDCGELCIADAGGYKPPPEAPIHIGQDSLDIEVSVEPQIPAAGVYGGFFTITVVAHNRSGHWATVMPTGALPDTSLTFSYDVSGATGGSSTTEHAVDLSERVFAPGESKRRVFDFVVGNVPFRQQLSPGDYVLRGGYAGYLSSDYSLTVGQ